MSETEKKGSPWPWFLVPIAAVSLFFVLRECRSHLPPANDHSTATAPETPAPTEAAPASNDPAADPAATAAPETPPAPQ